MSAILTTTTTYDLLAAIRDCGQLPIHDEATLTVLWAGEADVTDLRGESGATLWLVRVEADDRIPASYVVAVCASYDTAHAVTAHGWREAEGCPEVLEQGEALTLTLAADEGKP